MATITTVILRTLRDANNTAAPGASELLLLPDEVLLLILRRLQLRDLATVSRTCTRLQYLADDLAAHRQFYRHLDYQRMQHECDYFEPQRGASTFEQCMRFIGPHVQRIRFDGNLLQQHRNAAFAAVPADEYEAFYEHQSALTVELRQFAHFEAFWPLVERWFGQLHYVQLSFESGADGQVAAGGGKPSDAWKTRDLGDDCRALHSYGFHVDDRRLALIFHHFAIDGLYVECPDLEKSAVGGSGAGGCHEWSGFKGTALAELGDLRRLELVHCNRFQPQNFNMFAAANGASMQRLVIRECAQLCISPLVFRDVGMQFERLSHLEAYFLDTCPALNRLRELRYLRYLRLHMASDCDRLLEDLACNDGLQELHITDCLVDFSSSGFEDFALGREEFFTHLRRVTLHGNILAAPILARFGNEEHLEVLRFTYELALAEGLVQLVRISRQLRELEMYCTEWVTLRTMQDVVEALGERHNAIVLKILLTLEVYGGEDGERIEDVVDKFRALAKRNAHLIDIVIV